MSLQSQVWVVDDDRSIRWVLERALKADGIDVTTFQSADETLVALRRETPSVLVSDIRMPGTDGLTMLEINSRYPEMPVIIRRLIQTSTVRYPRIKVVRSICLSRLMLTRRCR